MVGQPPLVSDQETLEGQALARPRQSNKLRFIRHSGHRRIPRAKDRHESSNTASGHVAAFYRTAGAAG
jgi:hypothetical protein